MIVCATVIRLLLIGFVAGWIAGLVVRGGVRARGCLTNLVVGMLGAVIGGYLFKQLEIGGGPGFIGEVVTATIGAVILLVVVRLIRTS